MKMKKIVTMLLAMVVAIGLLAGCKESFGNESDSKENITSDSSNEEKPKIALLLMAFDSVRYTEGDKPGFEKACEALGYEPIVQSAEGNSETQIQQAENALNIGVSAIVMQPCSDAAAATIVEMAHEADVPVIGYNEASNNVELDGFVGRDAYAMYHAAVSAMVDRYPSGNYILVYGDEGTMVSRMGAEALLNVVGEHPDITVVSEQFNSDWNPETAMQQVESALSANNDNIAAVVCLNDSMATGVMQALESVGMLGKVGVSGADTELSAARAIVQGNMALTRFTEFVTMAEDAVTMADCLIRGEELPEKTIIYDNGYEVPYLPTEYSIVDADNMEDFLSTHEWWLNSEEVYAE